MGRRLPSATHVSWGAPCCRSKRHEDTKDPRARHRAGWGSHTLESDGLSRRHRLEAWDPRSSWRWRLCSTGLVRLGYAQVATFPPNVRYQELFLKCQWGAREAKRGLWGP
jgi:hypothetical protein